MSRWDPDSGTDRMKEFHRYETYMAEQEKSVRMSENSNSHSASDSSSSDSSPWDSSSWDSSSSDSSSSDFSTWNSPTRNSSTRNSSTRNSSTRNSSTSHDSKYEFLLLDIIIALLEIFLPNKSSEKSKKKEELPERELLARKHKILTGAMITVIVLCILVPVGVFLLSSNIYFRAVSILFSALIAIIMSQVIYR